MDGARKLAGLLAALLACLVLPAAANAAYAPKLAVTVKPTDTPGQTVAFTSVVTQASDEEPSKAARVKFPVGYSLNIAALQQFTSCTPAQRDARACPETSRLGTATAEALGQTLSGGVYLGEAAQIFIFLNNATLKLLGQEPAPITARTEFRPDGGTDTVLDSLPSDFTATRFELALNGPPKSIITAPEECGPKEFVGEFTSRNGVKATSRASVAITNCPPPALALSAVRFGPRSVRRGRRAALSYTLNRTAQVEVTVRRSGRRRVLRRLRSTKGEGTHRVTIATAGLTPGRYIARLRVSGGEETRSRVFAFTVRRR